jgi:hypothetical protein
MTLPEEVEALRHEVLQLQADVRLLRDREEINALLDRYVVSADLLRQDDFDESWARATFTDDVVLEFPPGDHEGIRGIAEFHRTVMERFERTWHLTSNHLIDLQEDVAEVRMTLLATHVHLAEAREAWGDDTRLTAYDHYEGTVARTRFGWRIKRMKLNIVAIDGRPPLGVQGIV